MSAKYNQVLFHWTDINGKECTNFCTTIDQGAGGAGAYSGLASALQAVSDCRLVAIQYQTTLMIGGVPSTGDYPSVLDRAVFGYRIAGQPVFTMLGVPGPKSSILLPGTQYVDLSNPLVIALQTQVMSLLGDRNGHAAGTFQYGQRQRARGTT